MDSKMNDDQASSFSMIVEESNCTEEAIVESDNHMNSPRSGMTILI